MKFSENWLRTFVDPALASSELADALTMAGLEVEAVEPAAPAFDKVVVAEVVDVQKHPDADRLTVCRVNAGAEVLQVVCGAPNVRAGILVPFAQVGAKLPGVTIKRAKVRGVESHGMLCSARELGIAEDASGLLVLAADAPVGSDIRAYLDLDDQLFTIKPTPNRGDCLSIFGVAREVSAITSSALKRVSASVQPQSDERIEIAVEAQGACPRYCGRVVRGIDARAATPRWMLQRLERSGLRGISAVVDVTNYVMLELGQPLHAFDLSAVDGGIRVRFARDGEQLALLNGHQALLTPEWLVIADHSKPLALAGVMGGTSSAVTLDTRDILLESAFFDPTCIAGKSRVLGFGSDASYRFERGVDFSGVELAMQRATELIIEICGGVAGPVCEASAALPARLPVRLRHARVKRLLGIDLTIEAIADLYTRLGFVHSVEGEEFSVTPPSYRFDLAIEQDMIEEIARIYGYERIPAVAPRAAASMLAAPETRASVRSLRALMAARDYQEVVSYSFVDRQWESDFSGNSDPVALVNPIAAQLSVMRSSLLGSLVNCLKLNLNHQEERVRLFEVGRCFSRTPSGYAQVYALGGLAYGDALPEQWGASRRSVDFYDVKADLEVLLTPSVAGFAPFSHPALHPGRSARLTLAGEPIGWLGELHPGLQQKYDLPFAPIVFEINLDRILDCPLPKYSDFSKLPRVRRDLSVEVREEVSAQSMLDALREAAPKIVSEVAIFDIYRGKGIDSDKKSVAFRIVLQDTLETLTDAEVETAKEQLLKVLQEKFKATLRN